LWPSRFNILLSLGNRQNILLSNQQNNEGEDAVMKNTMIKIFTLMGIALSMFIGSAVRAADGQIEPITLLVNFQIAGNFTAFDPSTGNSTYTIGGPGYAPLFIYPSGAVSDWVFPFRQVATLSNAQIVFPAFDPNNPPPVMDFTCIPGTCTMSIGGSVLQSDAGVPLEGRAPFMWGPVVKSPAYDPAHGVLPIRILGCGGLKETSGKGMYANMVGSVCFNGALNFNVANPQTLTGGSKCTITLHTPAPGIQIP
jgi:hypothetical protein